MLKPESSKFKESEATLVQELKLFEEQEDKTLQNFEMESKRQNQLDVSSARPISEEESFIDMSPKPIPEVTEPPKHPVEVNEDNLIEDTQKKLYTIKPEEMVYNEAQDTYDHYKTKEESKQKYQQKQYEQQPKGYRNYKAYSKSESSNSLDSSKSEKQSNYDNSAQWKDKSDSNKIDYKKSSNWVEKRLREKVPTWQSKSMDLEALGDALSLSDLVRQQYQIKNGSKIINWMIKNMPDGKQTIIVL